MYESKNLDICIYYMHIKNMKITWDPAKAKSNFQKHKIRFSDVEIVLSDPMALTVEDHDIEREKVCNCRIRFNRSDNSRRIYLQGR